jgi:integrase
VVKQLSTELQPSTVSVTVQTLRQLLRAAVADRVIASNPADGIKSPKVARKKVVPLELAEVEALADAVPDRYRASVIVAAGSGLRLGELFGLTVDRVDWLRRTLTVDRQLVSGLKGQKSLLGPPKTDASRRVVPVPDVVLRAMSEHMAAYPAGPDGLVFTSDRGTPVLRLTAGRVWRAAAPKAKLPTSATGWHALRHFYASVLIRAGESVRVVSERLGHTNAAMTLNVYAHLWPADDDRTRQAVEAALGGHRPNGADITRTSAD